MMRNADNLNTPPKLRQEMTGKKKRQMSGPEKYRGIEYSVAHQGEGIWTWKLHHKPERAGPIIAGTTKGGQNEAIEAAHRAVDKMLGTQRK